LALAHWLAATVHIARQAFAECEAELVAGAAAQDRQREGARFNAVGLHLLLGLLRLSGGDATTALQEFARELAFEDAAHIYTREASANTWCAIAAIRLRQADNAAALAAFDRAIGAVAGHPVAIAAMSAIADATQRSKAKARLDRRLAELRQQGAVIEAVNAEATYRALTGEHAQAAALVNATLEQAPAGSAGWILPVDSLLQVNAYPEHWETALNTLRTRAA
jgi:hypothetical protein